jgi:hypothetical protein
MHVELSKGVESILFDDVLSAVRFDPESILLLRIMLLNRFDLILFIAPQGSISTMF